MLSLRPMLRARIPLPQRSGVLAGRLLASLMICLALASAGLAQVRLEGRVRTDTGEPIRSGVNVRVETEEGQLVAEQPANSEGAFHFDSLPKKNNCRLIVTAEGFERSQEGLDLGYGSTSVTRYVSLRPLRKAVADGGLGKRARTPLLRRMRRKSMSKQPAISPPRTSMEPRPILRLRSRSTRTTPGPRRIWPRFWKRSTT